MNRKHLNSLGTFAIMLGVAVGCHPTRRPVSVIKKQPKLSVALTGMSDIGNPSLDYHLSGCIEAEGILETQASSVVFSGRNLKPGLGGCVVSVTSKSPSDNYEYTRGPGILWMSDEFAVAKEENGLLTSEAKMEKTYKDKAIPKEELFGLQVSVVLPQNTETARFSAVTGTLTCSDPIGPVNKNTGIKFDASLKADLIITNLKIPVDGEAITCSEISITAKIDNKELQFFSNLEGQDNSFIPRGNQTMKLNQGKPFQLALRLDQTPAVTANGSLGVELSACTSTQYFDDATNMCQPCPGGTQYREAVGACVLPAN